MRRMPERLAALFLIGVLLPATAQTPPADDTAPAAEVVQAEASEAPAETPRAPRLQGPVTISANQADIQREGVMSYRGNVHLESSEFELFGARLDLRQLPGNQFEARVSGAPARFEHKAVDGQPPATATAGEIVYHSDTQLAELSGGVDLNRDGDRLSGASLSYDLAARRIRAEGGEGSQVRIVIQPPAPPTDEAPQ